MKKINQTNKIRLGLILSGCCLLIGQAAQAQRTEHNHIPIPAKALARQDEAAQICRDAAIDLHAGNYAKAEDEARQSDSLDPLAGVPQEVLAAALAAQGKDQEALQIYHTMVVGEQSTGGTGGRPAYCTGHGLQHDARLGRHRPGDRSDGGVREGFAACAGQRFSELLLRGGLAQVKPGGAGQVRPCRPGESGIDKSGSDGRSHRQKNGGGNTQKVKLEKSNETQETPGLNYGARRFSFAVGSLAGWHRQ